MNDRKSFQPLALGLTLAAALLRLVPHPPNFTPVGGIALFGGSRFKSWQAYAVPLLAMLITDPILSHMAGFPAFSRATPVIYLCFAIYVALGRILLRRHSSLRMVVLAATLGSVQFFVLTNLFEWWAGMSMYAHTWAGLMACYAAALPFFSRTLAGDLFYSVLLFAIYELLGRRLHPSEQSAS